MTGMLLFLSLNFNCTLSHRWHYQGKSCGNALNMADMSPLRDFELPELPLSSKSGTIKVYVSSGNPEHLDISQMRPAMTAEAPVSMTIQPVLETLAEIYSPVKGVHLVPKVIIY